MDPQMRIGLVDPITGQTVPYEPQNIDPEMIKQVMATLKPDAPPAPKVLAGPDAMRQLPAAKPFDIRSNPNPAFINAMLNDQAAGASVSSPPAQTAEQRRDAILNQRSRGGLSQGGQYYTPMNQLGQQLGAETDAQRAGAAETQAKAALGAPLKKLREAAKVQYRTNNPDAKPEEIAAFDQSLDTIGDTDQPKSAPVPPVIQPKAPPSYSPMIRDLNDAAESEARDQTGAIIYKENAKGKKEAVKANRTPGEFIKLLEKDKGPEWLEQNFPSVVSYMESKFGRDVLDPWLNQRVQPWKPAPTDLNSQGQRRFLEIAQRRGFNPNFERSIFGIPAKYFVGGASRALGVPAQP